MDARSFDVFTQPLAARLPRRHIVASAVGTISTLLFGHAQTVAGCKKVGKKCDKNNDCCDGARCRGKKCKCKSGLDECGGKCFDLDRDENHCGGCDTSCDTAETCCSGVCVNTQTDNAHCGACDSACLEDEGCVDGVCFSP